VPVAHGFEMLAFRGFVEFPADGRASKIEHRPRLFEPRQLREVLPQDVHGVGSKIHVILEYQDLAQSAPPDLGNGAMRESASDVVIMRSLDRRESLHRLGNSELAKLLHGMLPALLLAVHVDTVDEFKKVKGTLDLLLYRVHYLTRCI